MVQSIIVYSIICFTLYYATQIRTIIRENNKISIVHYKHYEINVFFALLVFAFFSGVRWDVGIDHLEYIEEYKAVGLRGYAYRDDMESGFVYLMHLFNRWGMHYTVFLGLISFFQLGCIYKALHDVKYILPFTGVLIMCGGDFFFWMNGIRQAIVATIFVYLLTHFVVQKRFIPYLICILTASYIHKSALLLIVFYPFAYLKLEKIHIRRELQYIIFFLALFLSSTNIWTHLLDFVDSIFSLIGYDERFKMNRIENNIREQNFGVRKSLFFLIDIVTIYYSHKLRSYFPNKNFGLIYILYFLLIITQPLFVSSLVFNRITGYFYIFRAITSSFLLFYLFKISKTSINKIVGTLIMFFYLLHLFVQIYVDKGNHTDCIRYQFFWEQTI